MRRPSFAVAFLLVLVLLALPPAAGAKGPQPFRIVTPSGKVGWVRGATAKAWWRDYYTPGRKRGCSCTSAAAAARYAQKVASRWNHWPKPWLLVPNFGASMLYYPPTDGQPGYVLTPAVIGSHGRRWDDWEIASRRMDEIMEQAVRG